LTCSQTYCDCRAWYELHEGLAAYERERVAAGARIRLLALFELWVRREAGRWTAPETAIRRRHCELDMVPKEGEDACEKFLRLLRGAEVSGEGISPAKLRVDKDVMRTGV
jgi:hypothetical protein